MSSIKHNEHGGEITCVMSEYWFLKMFKYPKYTCDDGSHVKMSKNSNGWTTDTEEDFMPVPFIWELLNDGVPVEGFFENYFNLIHTINTI